MPTDPLGIFGVSSSADLTMSGTDFMLMVGKTFTYNSLPSAGAGVYKGTSIYLGPDLQAENTHTIIFNGVRAFLGLPKPCQG